MGLGIRWDESITICRSLRGLVGGKCWVQMGLRLLWLLFRPMLLLWLLSSPVILLLVIRLRLGHTKQVGGVILVKGGSV